MDVSMLEGDGLLSQVIAGSIVLLLGWLVSRIPGFVSRWRADRKILLATTEAFRRSLMNRERLLGDLSGLPVHAQSLLVNFYQNGAYGMYLPRGTPGLAILEEMGIVRCEFLERSNLAGERKYVIVIDPEIVGQWIAQRSDAQW